MAVQKMKIGKFWQRRLFYLVVILMAGIIMAALILSFSWINRPFAGFLIYDYPYVASLGVQSWPGLQTGLRYLDRIVQVNDRPLHRGKEVVQLTEKLPPGTMVTYLTDSRGLQLKFSIPVTLFGPLDYFLVFLIPFAAGTTIFIIGVIVYFMKPAITSSWVFLVACFALGTYAVTGFDLQSTYYISSLHLTIIPLMAGSFLHLALIFPSRKKFLAKKPRLQYLVYLPVLVLVLLYLVYLFFFEGLLGGDFLPWFPTYPRLTILNRLFALLCMILVVGFYTHTYLKDPDFQARLRARVILLGMVAAFSPHVIFTLLAAISRIQVQFNFLGIFITLFPAAIAYSIVRHNLFDADTIIRRTVGYVTVTAIVVGGYLSFSLLFNYLLGHYEIGKSRIFPLFFMVAILLIFNPLRNRVQSLVDTLFFRKEYDAKKIIDSLGAAITSLMDLPQILKQLVTTFARDMFIDNSAVLLLDHSGTSYQVRLSEGENRSRLEGVAFNKTEPLPQIIEREKKEITKHDVLEDPKYKDICLDCAQNFSTLYASLIIPMVLRGKVIGFLSLGDKKSGKFYNREDIDLLRTLAGQGAVAIENARLAEQMKNEELVRANLARYLSPQIVDQIIKQDVKVNLGGDRKEVTVLFSDIRNFTSISESMEPEQLVEFLNDYFTEMARIIFDHQGSLDKYIGDAIVAVFGSLIPLDNSAEPAVRAAVEMMREMVELNKKWRNKYGFNMEMGIGINTGEVFLGNIGSPERMEFTVIGDTVNTASRFSGLATGRQILLTRTTRDHLGPDLNIKPLPSTKVKGKAEEVEVFEIVYT
jgi:adenylate cyclase